MFSYIFSGSRCTRFIESSCQRVVFLKKKTEECNQKVGNVFDQFGIAIPCSATYFLEVSVRFSLKVATKQSIRGKKNSQNLDFQAVFLKKNGGVRPKCLKCFSSIWYQYTLFSCICSGSRCTGFTESSHERAY